MKSFLICLGVFLPVGCLACSATFNVTLETFGEGVTVELRAGSPGSSKVVGNRASSGGRVSFDDLCPGSYFLAIGDSETVSVTPTRSFQNHVIYSSRITVQRGTGNVSKRSRQQL